MPKVTIEVPEGFEEVVKQLEQTLQSAQRAGLIHCLGSSRPEAEWERALAWSGGVCECRGLQREGILIRT
jgi:hypothetical protein